MEHLTRAYKRKTKLNITHEAKSFCLWCLKLHKDGTKIKAKHEKLIAQLRSGKLPCEIGGCRPYLCSRLHAIITRGLDEFGSCNHLLAELNRINHFVELVDEEASS